MIGLLGLDFGFAASAEDGTSISIETKAIAIIAVVMSWRDYYSSTLSHIYCYKRIVRKKSPIVALRMMTGIKLSAICHIS